MRGGVVLSTKGSAEGQLYASLERNTVDEALSFTQEGSEIVKEIGTSVHRFRFSMQELGYDGKFLYEPREDSERGDPIGKRLLTAKCG